MPTRTVRQIVAISVRLEVNTPDQLKQIVFGLTKGTDEDHVTWKLDFEYHERGQKKDPLVKIVDLEIDVKSRRSAAVEKAATEGLTKAQADFAATTVAAAARRLAEGEIAETTAARTIERTFDQ